MADIQQSKIGVIGMGVMGANLARNFASRNIKTSVFNRTHEKTTDVISAYGSENLVGFEQVTDFVNSLEVPRKIIIMVSAGPAVDEVIAGLTPLLAKGDILIDAGNSDYHDSIRREAQLATEGFDFVGMGVSGGEEGALKGPSIMPGCTPEVWAQIKPILEPIAAKDFEGVACVTRVGTDGAGHFVKMVHNGIEYAVMELLAETYDLLRKGYGLKANEIADVMASFNTGLMKSYLLDISIPVLTKKDEKTGDYLINKILDKAGQKGTGAWTVIDALTRGLPLNSIAEAVMARNISAQKDMRIKLSEIYPKEIQERIYDDADGKKIEQALSLAIILSYVQGLSLIHQASEEHSWGINLAEICRIWEGGCIIRSQLLRTLTQIYQTNPRIKNLLEAKEIETLVLENIKSLREVSTMAIKVTVPLLCFQASLGYFESITSNELSANYIQGLRDYFGAHTYQRNDTEGTFHTLWED